MPQFQVSFHAPDFNTSQHEFAFQKKNLHFVKFSQEYLCQCLSEVVAVVVVFRPVKLGLLLFGLLV